MHSLWWFHVNTSFMLAWTSITFSIKIVLMRFSTHLESQCALLLTIALTLLCLYFYFCETFQLSSFAHFRFHKCCFHTHGCRFCFFHFDKWNFHVIFFFHVSLSSSFTFFKCCLMFYLCCMWCFCVFTPTCVTPLHITNVSMAHSSTLYGLTYH